MYIKTGGNTFPCRDYRPGTDSISFDLTEVVPEELGATVELCAADGFVMRTEVVADWMRWEVQGGALVLTNLPVPEPEPDPDPEPGSPAPMDDLTMTQLAVAELAQTVEDNNTATQLAIAELAEALLGGAT